MDADDVELDGTSGYQLVHLCEQLDKRTNEKEKSPPN